MESRFDEKAVLERLEFFRIDIKTKARELSAAIKTQVATGDHQKPNDTVRRLSRELRKLLADQLRLVRLVQRAHGISEAEIRAVERARDALPFEERYWRSQVEATPPSEYLDDIAKPAVERLLGLVDPHWLGLEAQKPYRLGSAFLNSPLHLVNGVRVSVGQDDTGPQRFARMLLVCQDHLLRRWDLDFFRGATFVPEIAVLGNSLNEISALGSEAENKLASLPFMTDEKVSATVYELLVGAACVRHGLQIVMQPEDRSNKVPDYRITGLSAIPAAIECKRRLGLTSYEIEEAQFVERLYGMIRSPLKERGIHGSLEASFRVPLRSVAPREFAEQVLAAVDRDQDAQPTSWGSLAFRRLVYGGNLPKTGSSAKSVGENDSKKPWPDGK